ncbi:MAG: hypothetical protein CL840_18615 [Crocinitomicaceae bacterium]|nr:hypothetical protein [Crocinitomicaceae bacterium]
MAIAVVLGALAAHALKTFLPPQKLESFQTAVRYQMIHSIAIILVVLLAKNNFSVSNWSYRFFQWGIILFSGSIYVLSTLPLHSLVWTKWLGPVTPIGGVLFILGWVFLALNISKSE